MKKLLTLLAVSALAVSIYGMGKAPEKESGAGEAVVKEACCTKDGSCKVGEAKKACCTKDGSCKVDGACKKAKADAEACTKKAVDAAAGCAGGTCPLPK